MCHSFINSFFHSSQIFLNNVRHAPACRNASFPNLNKSILEKVTTQSGGWAVMWDNIMKHITEIKMNLENWQMYQPNNCLTLTIGTLWRVKKGNLTCIWGKKIVQMSKDSRIFNTKFSYTSNCSNSINVLAWKIYIFLGSVPASMCDFVRMCVCVFVDDQF